MADPTPNADVRMRGFHQRATVEAALDWVDHHASQLDVAEVSLLSAGRRVLHQAIVSTIDVPGFDRSMMDGFAVVANDTLGASSYNPLPLQIIGDSLPGVAFNTTVQSGQAVRIMTGAPVPTGADAVLPVEKTEIRNENSIVALDAVSPGKNIGRKGEDIQEGMQILAAGRQLRPQDIGVLSSIGIARVPVVRQPRVRIVVTGNELLPTGSVPKGNQIVDANSPMLEQLIRRDGGVAVNPGIVPDSPDEILAALKSDADVILVSGGSSVGQEDHAPVLVDSHGNLAIHGIAMRPSSPAGMGTIEHRLIFLLPGNPVSCLCAYDFFAGRAIRLLAGLPAGWPYRRVRLKLRRKIVSAIGRVDYARVRIVDREVEPIAISGASVLSSTTEADGFVIIEGNREGFGAGTEVDVYLYDEHPEA